MTSRTWLRKLWNSEHVPSKLSGTHATEPLRPVASNTCSHKPQVCASVPCTDIKLYLGCYFQRAGWSTSLLNKLAWMGCNLQSLYVHGFVGGVPVLLAKPQTYMNLSGESVSPSIGSFLAHSIHQHQVGCTKSQNCVSLFAFALGKRRVVVSHILGIWIQKENQNEAFGLSWIQVGPLAYFYYKIPVECVLVVCISITVFSTWFLRVLGNSHMAQCSHSQWLAQVMTALWHLVSWHVPTSRWRATCKLPSLYLQLPSAFLPLSL
jgi:hypothetical protein